MKNPHVSGLGKFHNTAWFVYQDMGSRTFFSHVARIYRLKNHEKPEIFPTRATNIVIFIKKCP